MTKRNAEKIISRSILSLAQYRKGTMAQALARRPLFWTARKAMLPQRLASPHKALRIVFGQRRAGGRLTPSAEGLARMPPPLPPPWAPSPGP